VNQNVIVTVQGQGVCPEVLVNFGDGNSVMLQNVDFKKLLNVNAAPHPYSSAGTYKILATSGKRCQGSAAKDLVVTTGSGPPPFPLEQGVIKKILAMLQPMITGGIGALQPGSSFALKGQRFGAQKGKVFVTGDFGTKEMIVLQWGPSGIGFQFPAGLSGVKDQTVKIHVQTAAGFKSNQMTGTFTATREYKLVTASDVKVVSCSSDGNYNDCNGSGSNPGGFIDNATGAGQPFTSTCKTTICGRHENVWGAFSDDSGKDTYEIKLLNGWTMEEMKVWVGGTSEAGLSSKPSGFNPGLAYWKPSIGWWATPNDTIKYYVEVIAKGPAGVPFK